MEKHIKNYNSHFEIDSPNEWHPSELSAMRGTDYHHIINRMKSRPELDRVENVMLINFKEHQEIHFGKSKYTRQELILIHECKLKNYDKDYDRELMEILKKECG